jgi:hypothetical protein
MAEAVVTFYQVGAVVTGNPIVMAMAMVVTQAYTQDKARKARDAARDQYNAAQVDRMAMVNSTVPPRELVLGRVRKGGAVFYKASTGANSQDLYLAIAFAGHEIDAYEQFWLNDEPVTLDGSGFVTNAPYVSTVVETVNAVLDGAGSYTLPAAYVPGSVSIGWYDFDRYVFLPATPSGLVVSGGTPGGPITFQVTTTTGSAVQITSYRGAPGQTADPALLAAFPSDWSSANVVQGVAYIVVRMRYSETAFPSGIPNVSATIRGARVYDPRSTLTVWSENPALHVRHIYQHPKFGKATVTAAEDARIVAAANVCDTSTVYTVAGVAQPSVALYRSGMVLPFGSAAKDAFDDLVQAMGGTWAYGAGELYLKAGAYTAPVMTLTDSDLAASSAPIGISAHRERAQKFNTVKPRIWDSAQDYKDVSLTQIAPASYVAADGVEIVQEVQFPAVTYAPQAMHVSGMILRDTREPLVMEASWKLRAYPLEVFDTVAVTLARYGWTAKTFMIVSREWNMDGTIKLALKEINAAIYTMDATFPAQGFSANTNLPSPWVVGNVGPLTVTSGTAELLRQADGTVVSRMRVSWPQVQDEAVRQTGTIEVQYRLAGDDGEWSTLRLAGDETQVATPDVLDGAFYIVRARARTQLGVGAWCTQVLHQIVGKTEPPPAFDTFIVLAQPDGTRQYNFNYTTTQRPADWLGAEIRYTSGSVPAPVWENMTPLQDTATHYTASPVEINAPLAGTWTFACRSLDTTGNRSAYRLQTITLPDRRAAGDVFEEYYEHTEGWLGVKTGCKVLTGILEANDSTTWAGLPSTWAAWTRWNVSPTSPITYETPARDFGVAISGQIDSAVDADGTVVQELATSANGSTWSAWGPITGTFTSRYIKLRVTVTATGPAPVPTVRSWGYVVTSPLRTEYINDLVASSLTGSYRIGTGDIRIPLVGAYTLIKRTSVTIQDSSAGTWTATRIDQSLSPAPRWQFRLNGTLADPAFVDFFIEGY